MTELFGRSAVPKRQARELEDEVLRLMDEGFDQETALDIVEGYRYPDGSWK